MKFGGEHRLTALAPDIVWIWDKQPLLQSADVNGVVSRSDAQWDLTRSSLK